MGQLISHIRRLNVTEMGAEQLKKDLAEYHRTLLLFHAPEVDDMLICLQEIAAIYAAPADKVKNVIVEDLRHLDTSIVLALSRARSDYGVLQKGPRHWTKLVAAAYSLRSHRWDYELPWESSTSSSAIHRPTTLRKSSAPLSALHRDLSLPEGSENRASSTRTPVKDGVEFLDDCIPGNAFMDTAITLEGTGAAAAAAAASAEGPGRGNSGGLADAMRGAWSALSHPSTPYSGPSLMPSTPSYGNGNRDSNVHSTSASTTSTNEPLSKPLSNTMSSFLSSISSSRELAFESADPHGDMDDDGAPNAERGSSSEPSMTISSATDRIRSAFSGMRQTGEDSTRGSAASTPRTFSSFFRR